MDDIIKKLMAGGVSADMIEQLKTGLGDKFEATVSSLGLKGAAEKLGLDTTDLPEIDLKNMMEAAQELMGKDVDGDGKTGISEAVDNVKEAMANTDMNEVKAFAQKNATGVFAKIKSFFGANNA